MTSWPLVVTPLHSEAKYFRIRSSALSRFSIVVAYEILIFSTVPKSFARDTRHMGLMQ